MHLSAASDLAGNPLLPSSYDLAWTVVIVLLVTAIACGVVLVARAMRRGGRGDTGTSGTARLSQRLAELDQLRDDGAITPEEHREARARVLGTLP